MTSRVNLSTANRRIEMNRNMSGYASASARPDEAGYDVIGDIQGEVDPLLRLLEALD